MIDSLVRDAEGAVRIEPVPELRAELERAPGMKFAAFDLENKTALPGSSPELAAAAQRVLGVSPTHTHLILPGDPGTSPLGFMEPRWTPFGRFHIAVYRQKFRWDDIFHAIGADLQWLAIYLLAAMLMSAGTAWFAMRNGLTPLRAVVQEASGIDMNSLDRRLSTAGVPVEINPLVEAMNDALDRLAAGAARQRRFIGNAAHELRTPVAILNARLDAPQEPSFKSDLKRDARRIRNIVEQLLASSRLGERPNELERKIDLVALVRAAAADSALLAIKHKRQIAFETEKPSVLVCGYRLALESVVANLIDNALRAEPEGGTVAVRVEAEAAVAVVDHGEGVAPADRDVIFEPFWRKTEAKPGTGLGLAIAKELVSLHGGRIFVEDTPGGGATFKIVLPPAFEGAQKLVSFTNAP